jgi:hypothetical protein
MGVVLRRRVAGGPLAVKDLRPLVWACIALQAVLIIVQVWTYAANIQGLGGR